VNEQNVSWGQDGIDSGWLLAKDIGSVRSPASYRLEGWWYLPNWLPDISQNAVGPFKTKHNAIWLW
jgi:hypothetical protein